MFKIITGLFIAISCYAADTPFDNTRAKAYTYEEIREVFERILHPDVKEIFSQLTPVFWKEGFGNSPHGPKGLIDCWNCYYGSLKTLLDQENAANLQLQEIFHRMGDHAERVYKVGPELYPVMQDLESKMRIMFPENEGVLWHKLPVYHAKINAYSQKSYVRQFADFLIGVLHSISK